METAVLTFDAAMAAVEEALDRLADVPVPEEPEATAVVVRGVERLARRVAAIQVSTVTAIDVGGLHRADGHRTATAMVSHAARLSSAEAHRRGQASRALRHLPAVSRGYAEGTVGTCHVGRIARLYANPRVQRRVQEQDERLALLASRLSYDEFDAKVSAWERMVDEDGTADRAAARDANRDFRIFDEFDGGWGIRGRCGGLDGAEAHAILTAFVEAEFAADWESARAVHGSDTTVDHLARTPEQRRFDAFLRMTRLAASAQAGKRRGSVINLDVLIDQETWERELSRIAGVRPPRRDVDLDVSDLEPTPEPSPPTGETSRGFRCETGDGHRLDPREVTVRTLLGHVRRVVFGADSVAIDVSRLRSLFRGSAALAAMLNATHCLWPGCPVPASECQIDHLTPRRSGGRTCPDNGAVLCGHHNRMKEHGFTARRDRHGRMHVLRPNGTEIELLA